MPTIGWLVDSSGARVRLTAGGVLLGRAPDCDVVLASQRASRRHALVRMGSRGPEVVHLGRNPTMLNGMPVPVAARASDGDVVELPGGRYRVAVATETPSQSAAWALEHVGGGVFGMTGTPFTVGGAGDDLVLPAWPAGALTLMLAGGDLIAEPGCALAINGAPAEPGQLAPLHPGDEIDVGGQVLRVLAPGLGQGTTVTAGVAAPIAVRLQFLPRGGRMHLEFRDAPPATTWLADRRCDLVACLLSPPGPLKAGDLVEDPDLFARIWPREPFGRTKLNTLIYQTRKGLLRAGINGVALLERSAGGGATRFVLAAGARVAVE